MSCFGRKFNYLQKTRLLGVKIQMQDIFDDDYRHRHSEKICFIPCIPLGILRVHLDQNPPLMTRISALDQS